MYWTEQASDLMKTWTETQRKLFEGWLDLAGQPGGEQKGLAADWYGKWQEAAKKSLETWQSLTDQALSAQVEWAKSDSFASMFPKGSDQAAKLMAAWSEQAANLMRTWSESQKKLWQTLFDMAGSAAGGPQGVGGDWFQQWQKMSRESLESWDELVRRATEMQRSWMAANGQGDSGKEAAGGQA